MKTKVMFATFRLDEDYADGRRPSKVVFCTPEEDAKRRDFTVNAIFYDLESRKQIDFVVAHLFSEPFYKLI